MSIYLFTLIALVIDYLTIIINKSIILINIHIIGFILALTIIFVKSKWYEGSVYLCKWVKYAKVQVASFNQNKKQNLRRRRGNKSYNISEKKKS